MAHPGRGCRRAASEASHQAALVGCRVEHHLHVSDHVEPATTDRVKPATEAGPGLALSYKGEGAIGELPTDGGRQEDRGPVGTGLEPASDRPGGRLPPRDGGPLPASARGKPAKPDRRLG